MRCYPASEAGDDHERDRIDTPLGRSPCHSGFHFAHQLGQRNAEIALEPIRQVVTGHVQFRDVPVLAMEAYPALEVLGNDLTDFWQGQRLADGSEDLLDLLRKTCPVIPGEPPVQGVAAHPDLRKITKLVADADSLRPILSDQIMGLC